MKTLLTIAILMATTACAAQDDTIDTSAAATDTAPATTGPSASIPHTIIPDAFSESAGVQTYDARKAFDLTGDGRPETIVVHAAGPTIDSAQIRLSILSASADTLFTDAWDARLYFIYEDRKDFTDSAANEKVLRHLQRLLSDSSFTADGPTEQMKNSIPGGMEDAIRYDLKEYAVRRKNSLPAGAPLTPALHAQVESTPVTIAAIDSLVKELDDGPTFRYFAGGEVTYVVAWSDVKKRFVRIFACC